VLCHDSRVAGGGSGQDKDESEKGNSYSCVVLGGAKSAKDRAEALAAFKAGNARFLVCTDLAARGLDIQVRRTEAEEAEQALGHALHQGRGMAAATWATPKPLKPPSLLPLALCLILGFAGPAVCHQHDAA
jgi:hypothetical protein